MGEETSHITGERRICRYVNGHLGHIPGPAITPPPSTPPHVAQRLGLNLCKKTAQPGIKTGTFTNSGGRVKLCPSQTRPEEAAKNPQRPGR